jgi:hypothetical protein
VTSIRTHPEGGLQGYADRYVALEHLSVSGNRVGQGPNLVLFIGI